MSLIRGVRAVWIGQIAIALLLMVATWYATAVNTKQAIIAQQADKAAERHVSDARITIRDECLYKVLPDFIECAERATIKSQELRMAEQDLAAQRTMALWASAMFWIGLLSAIVSGLAIWMVWLNLKEARKATQAAMESATAAQETLTLEKGREQPRLFVTAKWLLDKKDVQITIKNIGKAPAIGVAVFSDFIAQASLPQAPLFGELRSLDGTILAPEEEAIQRSAVSSRASFYSGEEVVFGCFDYMNFFDQKRRVGFGFRYDTSIQRCVRVGGERYNFDVPVTSDNQALTPAACTQIR